MKVKEFLDKFSMGSNAIVTVHDATNEKEHRMFYDNLRYYDYIKYDGDRKIDVGGLKLNTFSVRDNALTIFAE